VNSLEKIEHFKTSLLRVDEPLPGPLGAVQMAVAAEKIAKERSVEGFDLMGMGGVDLAGMLPETDAELDGFCVDLARFALWLRSDDAPPITLDEISDGPPEVIAELLEVAPMEGHEAAAFGRAIGEIAWCNCGAGEFQPPEAHTYPCPGSLQALREAETA
jgi:hypothetical protein